MGQKPCLVCQSSPQFLSKWAGAPREPLLSLTTFSVDDLFCFRFFLPSTLNRRVIVRLCPIGALPRLTGYNQTRWFRSSAGTSFPPSPLLQRPQPFWLLTYRFYICELKSSPSSRLVSCFFLLSCPCYAKANLKDPYSRCPVDTALQSSNLHSIQRAENVYSEAIKQAALLLAPPIRFLARLGTILNT